MVYILFEVSSTVFVWQIRYVCSSEHSPKPLEARRSVVFAGCHMLTAAWELSAVRCASQQLPLKIRDTGAPFKQEPTQHHWRPDWGKWVLKDCWSSAVRTAEDWETIRTDNASKRKTQVKSFRCFGSWVNNKKCNICKVEKSTRRCLEWLIVDDSSQRSQSMFCFDKILSKAMSLHFSWFGLNFEGWFFPFSS